MRTTTTFRMRLGAIVIAIICASAAQSPVVSRAGAQGPVPDGQTQQPRGASDDLEPNGADGRDAVSSLVQPHVATPPSLSAPGDIVYSKDFHNLPPVDDPSTIERTIFRTYSNLGSVGEQGSGGSWCSPGGNTDPSWGCLTFGAVATYVSMASPVGDPANEGQDVVQLDWATPFSVRILTSVWNTNQVQVSACRFNLNWQPFCGDYQWNPAPQTVGVFQYVYVTSPPLDLDDQNYPYIGFKLTVTSGTSLAKVAMSTAGYPSASFLSYLPAPFGTDHNPPYSTEAEGGDPVATFTGALSDTYVDASLPGRGPTINFARSYNSNDTRTGPLGAGWTHSYSMRLVSPGTATDDAILIGPLGRSDTYDGSSGSFVPPPGVHRTLVRNADDSYTATDKSHTQWVFDPAGDLTSIRDRFGNTSTLSYDANGRLSTISDPAGRGVLTLGYTNGLLTSLTDWASPLRVVAYGYDGSGRLETITDREGKTTTYTYDGSTSRIATITDRGNHVALTTTYDAQGRAATQKDARGLSTGDVTTFDYVVNQDGTRVTTITLPGTSFEPSFNPRLIDSYDANGWLTTRVTKPSSTETLTQSFTYDVDGNRTSATDARGNRTDFCYDVNYAGATVSGSGGNLTRRIDPAPTSGANRPVTLLAFDANDNVTQIVSPKGVPSGQAVSCSTDLSAIASSYATDFAYDPQGVTLLSTTARFTDPDSGAKTATTKYEYGDAANPGLVTKVIPPRGNTAPAPDYTYATTLSYFSTGSKAGLVKDVTDPLANKTSYDYDSIGRVTASVDPIGNAAGSVPAEHTTTVAYDKEDRVRFETVPAPTAGGTALVTETQYSAFGKPSARIDANGQVTTYSYDARNSLLQVKESASAWTDPANPPGSVITTEYGYDAGGNTTRVTRAKGDAQYERDVDYVYDGRGLQRRETQYPAWPATTPSLVTASTYDGNGNQLTLVDPLAKTTTLVYDALDRLKSIDYSDPATADVSYAYDAAGSRTSMADGTGPTTYSYDEGGRLTLVTSPGPKAVGYRYDLDGNRTKLIYPDSTGVAYVWNKAEQLASLSDWASRSVSYTYWPDGMVKTATNPDSSIATYSYDNARRLTDVLHQVGSTTIARHTYQLDSVGNVTSLIDVAAGVAPHFSAPNTVNDVVTNDQSRPSAIAGADGAIYAAWADARSGDNDIYFSKLDPVTGAWSASQRVNNVTTGAQTQPVIAVDGSGSVYAIWADTRAGAADDDIYYSKRSATTGVWTTSARVNDDSAGKHQNDPSIAISGTGELIAAWYDERTNKKNIYTARLPAGGSTWSGNIKLTSDANAVKAEPEVTIGANGVTNAAWRDHRSGNADIWFATLASGGSTWSTNTKISDDPGATSQDAPDIGVDTAGNLTVVWNDARTSPSQIRSGRRPAGSSTWNASVAIGGSQANVPSILVRADGRAYASWYNGAPGSLTTVWGSAYDAGTNAWSPGERLTDTAEEAANPVMTFTTAQLSVLYQRKPTGGNYDIHIKRKVLAGDSYGYGYDRLYRLTSVSGVDGGTTYSYDPAGNRLTRVLGTTTTYTYDRTDRIGTAGPLSITTDANGNMTTKGTDSFAYDQANRLKTAVVSGATETYSYDGDGTRFSRQVGANPATRYVGDISGGLVATIDDGTRKYVYGHGIAFSVAGTVVEVIHADRLGSARVLTNSSGLPTSSYRSDEWGLEIATSGASTQQLRFTGEPRDATGLIYLRARYYDPSLARFATRDTWPGSVLTPQMQNRYSYAGNNPATYSDPSGHCLIDSVLDVGFVVYDIFSLAFGPSHEKQQNALALGADIGGALLPCVTGLGMVARAGVKATQAVTRTAARFTIPASRLIKIVDMHVVGGALTAGKSVFFRSDDIVDLIRAAENVQPVVQANGRLAYTVTASHDIGIDRVTGAATSVYTVITEVSGSVVTAFPGLP
jgi:RHS repeat-associated protein